MTNKFRSINSSLCLCQRNAVGHSVSSFPASRDAAAAQDTAAVNDCCEVCLVAEHDARIALVPCGHQRFCESCANEVFRQGRGCPICRAGINMILQLYQCATILIF